MITFLACVVAIALVMIATFVISFLFGIGMALIFGLKFLIRIPVGLAIVAGTLVLMDVIGSILQKK